jgi:hypothetical protein
VKLSPLSLTLLVAAGLTAGAIGFGVARIARGRVATPRGPLPLPSPDAALVLHVPHAVGNIALDGDLDDPGWTHGSARTNAFVGPDGVTPARPHSAARFVWSDGYLYVGLYAADEDIRAKGTEHDSPTPGDDVFHVVFTDGKMDRVIDISPVGVITDGTRRAGSSDPLDLGWESHARVSVENDGTMNQPRDHDEEWVIEMAIPFDALGLRGEKGETLGLSLQRCDTFRNGVTSCGSWGEVPSASIDKGAGPGKKGLMVLD